MRLDNCCISALHEHAIVFCNERFSIAVSPSANTGQFKLVVPTVIPDNERWLYDNPQTLRDLEEALAWSVAHPSNDSTTDAILKRMEESFNESD